MKTYKVTLRPLSPLSKIPDAQTIFGCVCTIIRFTKGEKELERYLTSLYNDPLFVHSSMFPEGLLPMAKVGLLSIRDKNAGILNLPPQKQLEYTTQLKKYKGLKYISLDIFKKYILDGDFQQMKKDIHENKIQIRENVVSTNVKEPFLLGQLMIHNKKTFKNSENRLFYDYNIFLSSEMCIYVKTDDIDYIKSVFKYLPYFGIGNRVSIGKNCFELSNIEEIEPFSHNTNYRMLLSKCISEEFNLDESNYMIDSHLYGSSNYYTSNKAGILNKFIEGSYMAIKEDKEFYGQIIKVNESMNIYHYGIGFVL